MSTSILERTTRSSNEEIIVPARRTPLYRSVDVLVCGGGLSGVAAAVSAARSGASTLLVERNVVLGGNGPLSFDIGIAPAEEGFAAEVYERLLRSGEAGPDLFGGGVVHDPEALKYTLIDLAQEAGVQLLLSTWVADPIIREGAVCGAMVENKSGRFAVPAKAVIDATGDGELAMRAGVTMRAVEEPAVVSMNYRIGGVNFDAALQGQAEWSQRITEAKASGALSSTQPDNLELYGVTTLCRERGVAYVRGPSARIDASWTTAMLGEQEARARNFIRESLPFLKTLPGFEASFLIDIAGTMQVGRTQYVADCHALDDGNGLQTAEADQCLQVRGMSGLIVTGRATLAGGQSGSALDAGNSFLVGERAGAIAAQSLAAVEAT